MGDVCLNAGEEIQCYKPLGAYATLPQKPSWCDKQEPDDDHQPKWGKIIENVAMVTCSIIILFCCFYLWYIARRQIKECICGDKTDSGSSETGQEPRNEPNQTAPSSRTEEGNEEEIEIMLPPGNDHHGLFVRDNTASDSSRAGEEMHSRPNATPPTLELEEGNQDESYA